MSRAELAEAVCAWLWETTRQRYELDAHAIARYERGAVRWPSASYRSGLRHVLGVATDEDLGFWSTRRGVTIPVQPGRPSGQDVSAWHHEGITTAIGTITREDLAATRREALTVSAALLAGPALIEPLQQWLGPLTKHPTIVLGRSFTLPEVEALEALAEQFLGWSSAANGALARKAVVAQLGETADRLREAPAGPLTTRATLAAAQLAETAASMSWDAGMNQPAQRYYVLAVQLAKLGGDDMMAAGTLAALARQCYDLGRPDDGLDVVRLAQYGTRRSTTARLRSLLATREAWAYAQRGDVQAFHRAVGLAEDHFAEGTAGDDPRSVRQGDFDDAELSGVIGARYRDLARHHPAQARHAQRYIGRALELRDPGRLRNRAFDLIGLARTHLITAEPDRAAELIGQALPLAHTWAPGRVGAKLRDFHREATPLATVPAVRQAREAIHDLIIA